MLPLLAFELKVTRTERERKVKISDFSGEEKKFQIDVSAECVVQWSFRRVSSRSKSAIALPKKSSNPIDASAYCKKSS